MSVAPECKKPEVGAAALSYEDAKPFNQIPELSFFQILLRGLKGDPNLVKNKAKYHLFFGGVFKEKQTNILRMTIPGVPTMVMIQDPEDVKTLITGDDKNPVEPGFDFFVTYRQELRKDMYPGSAGLLGSHGEKWYEVRSKVQQDMLRPKSALYYIDDITKASDDFLDLVSREGQDNTIEDITPLVYRWALEAVGAIFLNTRIGCLDEPPSPEATEMIAYVEDVLGDAISKLIMGVPLWKLYRTKHLKTFDMASEGLFKASDKLIKDAIKKFDGDYSRSRDEKSVLEKLIDKCGKDSDIPTVMAMDALMAGIDTTGNTSAFLFYHLAANPEKQEILYQEIKAEAGEAKITPEILNEMKYLKAFQRESQRLLPAVGGVGRKTQKDLVLSGYKIPKDTNVSAAMTGVMRMEEHYENATQFKPERFLRSHPEKQTAHPFSFVPFGHGARMCIGRRFAELEVQIIAIQTLRRFKLEYDGGPVDIITPFVNRPDGPIRIKFTPRTN